MKTCFKCGECKPLSEFYRHKAMADGHLNKCKDCAKRDVTAHRDANIDRIRSYDRERAKLQHRASANVANVSAYRAKHRKRAACNSAVSRAVKAGKLSKLPCWICGDENVEGHHPDYDAPLDVVWLCPVHHKEIHLKHPR